MQLRPRIANFDLSSENTRRVPKNLDISLFERLCAGGTGQILPSTRLTVQRRMRPEIADLVRKTLYPELLDSKDVENYPNVTGVCSPIYWFDHSNNEDLRVGSDMKETSHSNKFEVDMVIRLVIHLKKQGCYEGGDIAILTPYLGQLRKLRDSLKQEFSVEMSERDQDELGTTDEGIETHSIERKPLLDTVRLATVRTPNLECLSNMPRSITSRERKPR